MCRRLVSCLFVVLGPNTNNCAAAGAPGVIASGGSSSGSSSSSDQRDSKQYLAVSNASSIMSDGLSASSLFISHAWRKQ